jgi:DNA-binding PadR family transcriptional regulator
MARSATKATADGQRGDQGGDGGLPPAAQAILALLALGDGTRGAEGYGYDLARQFSAGQPLAEIIHLEPGMLYHHLKRLDKAGWISGSLEPQGSRPPRQVYTITEAGRAELGRWLAEPVARTREIRLEFLVKLFFARRINPELAARLVAEQRETFRRLVASLSEQRAAAARSETDTDRTFVREVLDLRLAQTQAALDWLDRLGVPGT